MHAPGAQILLDQHPPYRRRSTKRSNAALHELVKELAGIEAFVVVRTHAGLRVPRRKQARPGVLRPARRAQIQVHVPGLKAQPVHGGQVPNRVTHLRMRHQLRPRGGAGSEIQKEQVVRTRRDSGLELHRRLERARVWNPPRRRTDRDAHGGACDLGEARGERGIRDNGFYGAPLHAVGEIVTLEERRRRNDDGSELDGCEHRLPQRHDVAEHDENAIPGTDALGPEEICDLGSAARQLRETQGFIATRVIDYPQCRGVIAGSDHVKVVAAPVEVLKRRPAKLPLCGA